MLSPRLFMIHDTRAGGEDDVTKRTSRHEQVDPVLNLCQLDIESRADDSAFVDSAIELDDNLARAVVVDLFELVDVAWK
jgi:hypothetical protein